ncbi:helix-turn-helix domain-containing protein [Acanthopleuribacter pedis]|uniref:Helix-turn-helix domain-containing protein n=1 Tax=Acanthopleuribacter pedis TaxID=442870 RepID=A0A8J7QPA9_9BACT|nr:helix-turn-helix domain-containing protein [Acanthopleuribacter pedis]MBO1322148.1 helix-turn-helix domain-containing protein [Acanthopleuribacter pedis]
MFFTHLFKTLLLFFAVGGAGGIGQAQRMETPAPLAEVAIRDLHEDRYGFWWLATPDGLQRFEGYRRVSVAGALGPRRFAALGDDDFLLVGQGGAWVFSQAGQALQTVNQNDGGEDKLPADIGVCLGDGRGRVWFAGADSDRLIQYDHPRGTLRFFKVQGDDSATVSWRSVYAMTLHGEAGLWLGTDRGLFYLSFATDRLVAVKPGVSLPHGYQAVLKITAGRPVSHLRFLPEGGLLAATSEQLLLVSPGMESPVILANASDFHQDRDALEPESSPERVLFVRDTMVDEQQRLWLAGDRGLWMLPSLVPEPGLSLPPKRWRSGPFRSFFEDRLGTRWVVGAERGVLRITDRQELGKVAPPVLVTALQLNYQPVAVAPDRPEALLRQPPFRQTEISVPYDQNHVGLSFTGLDFSRLQDIRYRFKMEGLTPDWVELEAGRRQLLFADLAPGAYRLRLQAADAAGRWMDGGHAFEVQVNQPWFASPWAVVGYAGSGLMLLLVFSVLFYRRDRRLRQDARHDRGELQKQKQSMEKERKALRALEHRVKDLQQRLEKKQDELQETRRREQAAEARGEQFLLQVNHQLRDAFAMTLDGLAQIRRGGVDLPQQLEPAFTDVEQGVAEAWRRVDLLLDRGGQTPLPPAIHEPFDLGRLLDDFRRVFRARCERLGIQFSAALPRDRQVVVGDAELLRRVLHQLLDFATRHEQTAAVDLEAEGAPLRLQIAVSLPDGDGTADVFDALLRDRVETLCDALAARITWFEGEQGPVATIDLAFEAAEAGTLPRVPREPAVPPEPTAVAGAASDDADAAEYADDARPSVLVVAGSRGFRRYLAHKIKDSYRVIEAADYRDALVEMRRVVPDLILCDAGMISLGGDEDLVALKNADPALSHIAVVMLTATAGEAHQINQREQGGVTCLIKPFQTQELLDLLARHLDARREAVKAHQQQLGLGGDDGADTAGRAAWREEDARLLADMTDLIHGVDDENRPFPAEVIAEALDLTLVQLERKVEALLGLDLHLLIRDARLKLACELLAEDEPIMNQIAFRCGYRSLRDFAMAFREVYGMTPTEFLNQNRLAADRMETGARAD